MTKFMTVTALTALLLGGTSLSFAQTSSTTTTMPSNTAAPAVTLPSTGAAVGAKAGVTTGAATGTNSGSATGTTSGSATVTAPGVQSAMKSDQDVKKKLESVGYSDVTDIKQDKNGYTASAMKNGKRVKVDVDANGKIGTMN